MEVRCLKPEKKKSQDSGLISLLIKVVVKFFIYLTVYIKNFKNLKMHIFGFFMAIAAMNSIPNRYIKGCSNTEWIMFLVFTSFALSGAVSGYVYAKFKTKTEVKQVLQNENPETEQPGSNNFEPRYTIEEGIEDITPLENGGFRRIYKVRRS